MDNKKTDSKAHKKNKNEVEELNEIFEKFQKNLENYDKFQNINYEEIYTRNELIHHFQKRIIQCNNLCITHPEIKLMLYEEESCLNSCQRKINEVQSVVTKYMNNLSILSNFLDPGFKDKSII